MKTILLALALAAPTFPAQAGTWQPEGGRPQIRLWPGAPPHRLPVDGAEYAVTDPKSLVAGKPVTVIERVSQPTLTLYRPRGGNSGTAVVVYPGGGFWILAIDLEGTDVCDWLTARGIACILVKYRVPGDRKYPRSGPYPDNPVALEDAQRAIAITRFHARAWGIDPHKIGVLGFSAGGYLVAATSTLPRVYRPLDAVDRMSARPDFGIALYPGHLWLDEGQFQLNRDVPVSARTPPQFIVQNQDDPVDSINNALVYYTALTKAGVRSELHVYPTGGHAFGLRHDPTKPASDWPRLAERWLRSIGMMR